MYKSYCALRGVRIGPKDCSEEKWWPLPLEAGRRYSDMLFFAHRRRPLLRENDFLGMGPDYLQEGDLVVIFLGARVPHIVREVEGGIHELVGECYVHGILNGEFIESQPKTQTFTWR